MDFNIFGVGVWELALIFMMMLTIAGPKRMIKWAYDMGRYTAKFRAMFQETMDAFKREIDASDPDLRKDIKQIGSMVKSPVPRFDIVKEANKVVKDAIDTPAKARAESSASQGASSTTAAAAADPAANGAASTTMTAGADSTANSSTGDNAQTAGSTANSSMSNDEPRYDSWQPK